MPRWQRAIVIGASSGIGRSIARQLALEGTSVSLVARRAEALQELCDEIREAGGAAIWSYVHDVRQTDGVRDLFAEMVSVMDGLDLVVYASGVQPVVGAEQFPIDVDLNTIAINFSGAVAWLDVAADRFVRAGRGTIIGIGSVAGDRGRRGNPVYGATKAALASYLEALRNRLAVKGVTVTTVKPGFVATRLLEQFSTPPFVPVATPDDAARELLDAAAARKRVVYVPSWWRVVMFMVRAIPAPLFERLNV